MVQKASSQGMSVSSPLVSLGGGRSVGLEVMPLQEPGAHRKCMLVLFREIEQSAPAIAAAAPSEETRVQELERELLVSNEYLQTTVHDLEATNEELQSANEELQSANEELQSTNEEL